MKETVQLEVEEAKKRGHVDKDGVPLLTVVADGSWAKRSYRTNYSSLFGVAAIVGFYTRKVIFIGVKNKYCTLCIRADVLQELGYQPEFNKYGGRDYTRWLFNQLNHVWCKI